MLSRFSGVDEVEKEIANSKFPMVGIPVQFTWVFGKLVRLKENNPNVLIIKEKEYPIVANINEVIIIITPGV